MPAPVGDKIPPKPKAPKQPKPKVKYNPRTGRVISESTPATPKPVPTPNSNPFGVGKLPAPYPGPSSPKPKQTTDLQNAARLKRESDVAKWTAAVSDVRKKNPKLSEAQANTGLAWATGNESKRRKDIRTWMDTLARNKRVK